MNKKLVEAAQTVYQAFPSGHSCFEFDRAEDFEKMNFIIYGNDEISMQMHKEIQSVYFYTWCKAECDTNPDVVSDKAAGILWSTICELRKMLHNGIVVMNAAMCRYLMEKYNFLSEAENAKGRISVLLTGMDKDPLSEMVCPQGSDACEQMMRIAESGKIAAQNIYGRYVMPDCRNLLALSEYPNSVLYAIYAWHEILHRYRHAPRLLLPDTKNAGLMLLLCRWLGIDDSFVLTVSEDMHELEQAQELYRNICVFAPRFAALGLKKKMASMSGFKQEIPRFYILDEPFEKALKATGSEQYFFRMFNASVEVLNELYGKTLSGTYYGTPNSVQSLTEAGKTFTGLYSAKAKGRSADINSVVDKLICFHVDKLSSVFFVSR